MGSFMQKNFKKRSESVSLIWYLILICKAIEFDKKQWLIAAANISSKIFQKLE
jgi:hypothetical protein